MKVLLVYCNSMLENALPVGLSQLASCLKQAGISLELFDTTFYRYGPKSDMENRIEALQFPSCPLNFKEGNMETDWLSIIEKSRPDLIAMSVVEPTFLHGMKLLESARQIVKKNNIQVALGGVHAILAPETILKYDLIDYICISEGEIAFIDLCRKIERGESVDNAVGFWVKKGSGWIKNSKAPLVDINNLPILDFNIYEKSYLNKPMMGRLYRTISIETTRGCPWRCSYCGDKAINDLFKDKGSWYRPKSIKRIEEELREYVDTYSPEFVYIMSESFLSGSKKRVKEFSDIYKPYSIPFWFNTRPEDITEEKVKLVKEMGCKRISIGLEHGNEGFRKKFLQRNYSNDDFRKACAILKAYQISFSVNVIIGFPYEKREMIFDAIDLLRNIKPDGISTHIYSPYHGSEMRKVCEKEGMIYPDLIAGDFFQMDYLLNNPTISKADILGLFRTIPLYVEMDKKEYPKIKKAEGLDEEGNKVFRQLKEEFYDLKGWNSYKIETKGVLR
ncbi:B12-binding domain-containing radical SAM protein [Candidatus Omnitrophota bacterium]